MNYAEVKSFKSQTKLMVTGEYLVLKGALSLSLPLKFSQRLTISKSLGTKELVWKSMINNDLWFSSTLLLPHFQVKESNNHNLADTLCQILIAAKKLNPDFLQNVGSIDIISFMDFDPSWGIGSSSSLISNIAYWAECDPFELNQVIFNGSGYDIACARSSSPIIYQNSDGHPNYREANFQPEFHENLYFVYLNRKQNSRESILKSNISTISSGEIHAVSELTLKLERAKELGTFQSLMDQHEELISKIIQIRPVKNLYFKDFRGSIKSLGAWGGDYIMVASTEPEEYIYSYFESKNLHTIFRYKEIVLSEK